MGSLTAAVLGLLILARSLPRAVVAPERHEDPARPFIAPEAAYDRTDDPHFDEHGRPLGTAHGKTGA